MKTDNELIAEFMDFECNRSIPGPNGTVITTLTEVDCRYSTSWDWLIPIVYKIESLMPKINMPQDLEALRNGTHGSEIYMDVVSLPINTPIADVYKAVVNFIKWYNQQTK